MTNRHKHYVIFTNFFKRYFPAFSAFLEVNIQFRFLITCSQWSNNTEASSADPRMGRWPLWPWEPGELTVHMQCLRFVSARPDPRSPVKMLREAFFAFLFLLSRAWHIRSVGRCTGRRLYRTPPMPRAWCPNSRLTTWLFSGPLIISMLSCFSSMTYDQFEWPIWLGGHFWHNRREDSSNINVFFAQSILFNGTYKLRVNGILMV